MVLPHGALGKPAQPASMCCLMLCSQLHWRHDRCAEGAQKAGVKDVLSVHVGNDVLCVQTAPTADEDSSFSK